MASVEQTASEQHAASSNGHAGIRVENPATGQVIATVPDMSADEVRRLAETARRVQPAWDALGFDARGRILRRAQRWIVDNRERVIDTIVSETGKTFEDAQVAELLVRRERARILGQERREVPRGREGQVGEPVRQGQEAHRRAIARSGSSA